MLPIFHVQQTDFNSCEKHFIGQQKKTP